jgi:hypothetical protein
VSGSWWDATVVLKWNILVPYRNVFALSSVEMVASMRVAEPLAQIVIR